MTLNKWLLNKYIYTHSDCKHYQKQRTLINVFVSRQIIPSYLFNSDISFRSSNRKLKNLSAIVIENEFIPEFNIALINIDFLTYSFNVINYLQKFSYKCIACI